MAGRKLKALIPAKNDDVIYEQPLIYYSSQDRQYLLLVAADTPGQNMTQFIPEVSKCYFFATNQEFNMLLLVKTLGKVKEKSG